MKLHINDAASLLNLPVNTLKRWIRQGRVPINRSEDICIFKEEKLHEWAKRNNFSFSEKKNIDKKLIETSTHILSSAISKGKVLYDAEGKTKEEIFSYVVKKLGIGDSELENEFLKRLLEREELSSTGIGKGVAIPHPREPIDNLFSSPFIAVVFPKEPIEFDSIDNKLVFVLFFLVSKNVKEHLKLLSNLSYCLRHENFIGILQDKPSMEKIITEIEFFENQLLNQ
ncbi:MAG: PTS sugar transporter subunit IIA [Desulfobacteraceae bacterium]|nr:PTS sugar transporter subunit IIA [Desulfobacteraceae bacterium]MCB9494609.1 PTS sugar transporter subunit IIA [Desulfobacteraceae bacterium]